MVPKDRLLWGDHIDFCVYTSVGGLDRLLWGGQAGGAVYGSEAHILVLTVLLSTAFRVRGGFRVRVGLGLG